MDKDPRFERLIAEGLAASEANRSEAAIALFAQASGVLPSSGIPHFLIGSEHAAAANVDAAEAAFANAVLLAPGFALARYQLGLLQFSSQRAGIALVTWEPLFSAPATEALGHFVRGFAELAQDQFEACLLHFRTGMACADGNAAVCSDIAKVVESVEKLLEHSQAAGSAAPAQAAGHVLLAGYSRGLH
jgi:hypothetical protein